MKELGLRPGNPNITKNKIRKVVIHTTDMFCTKKVTDRISKILESTYKRADIDKFVYIATKLNS